MTAKEALKYMFWGIIGCLVFVLGIIPVLIAMGLIKVGKSFYHEVVKK